MLPITENINDEGYRGSLIFKMKLISSFNDVIMIEITMSEGIQLQI